MAKLSDVNLARWYKARKPIFGKSDGGGLTYTQSAAGTATWVFRYRFASKQRELTLGNYPDMSLKAARKAATAARAMVDTGRDVAAEKRKGKLEAARAGTFKAISDDYLRRVKLASRTRAETERHLKKDILPRIGHLPAREIVGGDIVSMVERIAQRSDPVARRAFQIVSTIYAHGVAKHLVPGNPCSGLKLSAMLGKRPVQRERINLTEEELRAVFAALSALGPQNELAIKILLATCARKGELVRARWRDVDLDAATWEIPPEHSKTGIGFTVPLAPKVVTWFKELRELAGGSAWVLPGDVHRHRPMSDKTLNGALGRLEADVRAFSPHDLRSTARSHLAKLGVNLIVAERCLNHTLGGLVARYDKHDYLDERRNALELWASFLETVEQGRPWNVTPIKKAAPHAA